VTSLDEMGVADAGPRFDRALKERFDDFLAALASVIGKA